MADLVVIVPSRGRPEAAAELAHAFRLTCTADTRLLVAIDYDDPTCDDYAAAMSYEEARAVGTVWRQEGPTNMVEALNSAVRGVLNRNGAAIPARAPYTDPFAIGFMGDDHRPRTVAWDQRYLDALREMSTGIVYGNDLFQGHRLPTQVAMTADIVRAVGYMAPPALRHLFVDNTWLRWGKSLDRIRYLPDVIVEHRHPHAGKAQWDEGYLRVNSGEVASHDEAVFNAYVADGLDADLAKIRAVMAVAA
jgi:hypothetical protein